MDTDKFKESYTDYEGQIEHIEEVPPKQADSVNAETVLSDVLAERIPFDGIYSHQANALELLDNGVDVCVTTPTSSGKTLIYALHIAREARVDSQSTALLVYPTKALSRDQESELNELYETLGVDIDIGVYDGDASSEEKRRIRRECDIVITNFQGLNYYLPHHEKWGRIFRNLSTVVIDESHTYTGIEGMHVAWIVRRLRRLVEHDYNSNPSFVLSSATIGNPTEHAKNLTGRDVEVVSDNGSPRGKRDIILWNPPSYIDNDEQTLDRRSPHRETSDLLAFLAVNNLKTLAFAPSRKTTELCAKWSQETLNDDYAGFYDIEPYNAGHRKDDRREVENDLKQGNIDGVVSTTALELGIDIGDVDATLMDGYPGRRASFWQQAGRSGRGTSDALSILVTHHDSIDQYIVENPSFLLDEDVENAVIDLSNETVLALHLRAAANEAPLTISDAVLFGTERCNDAVTSLMEIDELEGDLTTRVRYAGSGRPEADINLYSTTDEQYDVYIDMGDDQYQLPSADKGRAFRDYHPSAIYMYKGNQYEVTEFDREAQEIYLEYTEVGYYTEGERDVEIRDLEETDSYEVCDGVIAYRGTATIAESYSTYSRVYFRDGSRESNIPTGLSEPIELATDVMWVEFNNDQSEDITDAAAVDGLSGSLHATEHGLIKMSPTVITADSQDLGGLSTANHPETGSATVFIYDGVEGGVGFSHEIYNHLNELAGRTQSLLGSCECESDHGCPACTMSHMCGDNNEPMDSLGAQFSLGLLSSD